MVDPKRRLAKTLPEPGGQCLEAHRPLRRIGNDHDRARAGFDPRDAVWFVHMARVSGASMPNAGGSGGDCTVGGGVHIHRQAQFTHMSAAGSPKTFEQLNEFCDGSVQVIVNMMNDASSYSVS